MAPFRPNRRILWKKRAGENSWGDAAYAEPQEILARVSQKGRMASGAAGQETRAIHNIVVQ